MQHDGEAVLSLRRVQTLGLGKFHKPFGNPAPEADCLLRLGFAPENVLPLGKCFWPDFGQGLLDFLFNKVFQSRLKRRLIEFVRKLHRR